MDLSQLIAQALGAAGVSTQVSPGLDLSLGTIVRAAVILVLVYLFARLARALFARGVRRTALDARLQSVVPQLAFYGIVVLGIVYILGEFGLSVVLLGIAVGFALRDLIENFAAGLLLMGTRPFQPGDWVVIGPSEGTVREVGWRGTFLDTADGRRIIVPNASIIKTVVVNNSREPQLRSSIPLSVDLNSDPDRVERIILESLQHVEGISSSPAPTVLLDSLSGNAMNLVVWIWVTDPARQQKRVVSAALRAIKQALPANDIDLNPATVVTMSRNPVPEP